MKTFKELREHIVKSGSKYKLVSKKSGKNLGTYDSKAGAEKRERQVQYFKHMSEDGGAGGAGAGAVSAGPTNTVGSGNIAGAGQPPGSKSGEPGVDMKKRKKSPIMLGMGRRNLPKM